MAGNITIFISYSYCFRADDVLRMADFLARKGYNIENIDSQNSMQTLKTKLISQADVVLCFFSEAYAADKDCMCEIETAIDNKKVILPIALQPSYSPDGDLGLCLQGRRVIDYFDASLFRYASTHICEFIDKFSRNYSPGFREGAVQRVADYLKEANYETFIDRENISGNMYDSVTKGIADADVVLCFLSNSYAKSRICNQEVQFAANLHKQIVPIIIEQDFQLHGPLIFPFEDKFQVSYIDASSFNHATEEICQLIESISKR